MWVCIKVSFGKIKNSVSQLPGICEAHADHADDEMCQKETPDCIPFIFFGCASEHIIYVPIYGQNARDQTHDAPAKSPHKFETCLRSGNFGPGCENTRPGLIKRSIIWK